MHHNFLQIVYKYFQFLVSLIDLFFAYFLILWIILSLIIINLHIIIIRILITNDDTTNGVVTVANFGLWKTPMENHLYDYGFMIKTPRKESVAIVMSLVAKMLSLSGDSSKKLNSMTPVLLQESSPSPTLSPSSKALCLMKNSCVNSTLSIILLLQIFNQIFILASLKLTTLGRHCIVP